MELKKLKITPRRLALLEKMGITTTEQLLRYYPFRYEMIEAVPFDQWKEQDHVAFEGLICSPARVIKLKNNRSMTQFHVLSWNEEIQVTIFNRPWPGQFSFGKPITVLGMYMGQNKVTASNANFQPMSTQEGLQPVYSLPKEMKQADVKAIMKTVLPYADELPKLVPERFRKKYRLVDRAQALNWIHNPTSKEALHQAMRALKYEEFLCFQCTLQSMQLKSHAKEPARFDRRLVEKKIQELPYALTKDQDLALNAVLDDMEKDVQMVRMVQGDVGCGKTVVAAMAVYACTLAGRQAALLAPTEILARQHVRTLESFGIECRLLTSSLPAAQKREILEELQSGSLMAVVGTHSLFSEQVEFERLGLVVADEQQRFGVKQRRALLEKGDQADFLMMTATPIPRTYAHFLYGDIALSSIHTMPPGREPVKTKYVPKNTMAPILKEVMEELDRGRQLYVVCPSIEDNPETDMKAAQQIYEGMQKTLGQKYSVDLMHGKMKSEQKDEVMARFASGETRILVSTTVVEVGIDVGNATMMVIYDAHRFGLSTIHQLRGRAARGKEQGLCYLLSASKDPLAKERLKKLETLLDGFSVSQYDLEQRG
ncbi:MAG: ATP-dependent DNA helicase RecG, partial [Ileibacterium sp.]|nr:ATP-dependent DNA helicase RecG [Ileibacterium sp.]